jgi:hypothetical protein
VYVMRMIHLSPETVEFLNCLYRSSKGIDIDLRDALSLYREAIGKSKERFRLMEQVTVSEEEKTLFSNASFLFDKREELLRELEKSEFDTARFSEITTLEFDLHEALKAVHGAREKAQFSPIPEINGFLLVAWAYLHNEGPFDVIRDYFPTLSGFFAAMEEDFKNDAPYLKKDAAEGFSFGFAAVRQGIDEITRFLSTSDRDLLGTACYKIKEGADILSYYVDGKKQKIDRLWQQFSRFTIPLVGPDLQILLEDAKEGRTEEWPHKVEMIEIASMTGLMEFWKGAGQHLFINPSKKQALVSNIDRALARTQNALGALKKLTDETVRDYEDALEDLSRLFSSLEGETLKWPSLIGTGGELLGETIKGIYYDSLPDFTLEEIIRYLRSSPFMSYQEDAVASFEAYLQDWDKEHLLQGLEKLLSSMPHGEEIKEEASSMIPCTFCGVANEPSRTFCSGCNARLMLKTALLFEENAKEEPTAPIFISDLPLPLTAEPLVRLLRKAETDECGSEEAAALIDAFTATIRETLEQLRNDKSLDNESKEKMASIMAEFSQAAEEASAFVASRDPAVLRQALGRISRASIEAKSLEKEE